MREVGKDGAQGCTAREVRHTPTGRVSRAAEIVRLDPRTDFVSSDPAVVCRWVMRWNRSASEKRGFQGERRTHFGPDTVMRGGRRLRAGARSEDAKKSLSVKYEGATVTIEGNQGLERF